VTTATIDTYHGARDALRAKDLRQALYDDGRVVMGDCLLDLHGEAHRDRRRLENRLFRREVFAWFEAELLPPVIDANLAAARRVGRADLVRLGYRTVMHLTALVAGIDVADDPAEHDLLETYVVLFSKGATLVHATGDRDELREQVARGLEAFDAHFLAPSIDRRRAALAKLASGQLDETELPRDVLTTLLRNVDRLDLPHEVVRREVAFYLQAGGHSTANALTHALDDLWSAATERPELLERARRDRAFLQRCVHESLRLHPASPVARRRALHDVELAGCGRVAEGDVIELDLERANRDPSIWGPDADRYEPTRAVPEGVAPWGLTFGSGTHACIGMELDGGLAYGEAAGGTHLFGTVTLIADAFLAAGARPDPAHPAQVDPGSTRHHFATYPVVLS
jgi:cytochrome P450